MKTCKIYFLDEGGQQPCKNPVVIEGYCLQHAKDRVAMLRATLQIDTQRIQQERFELRRLERALRDHNN